MKRWLYLAQHEVGEERDVVFSRLLRLEAELLHHVAISCSCCKQEKTAMILHIIIFTLFGFILLNELDKT